MQAQRIFIFLFSAALSLSARGEEQKEQVYHPDYTTTFSHLKTSCKMNDHRFELRLGSSSKEDDSETQEFGYPFFWIEADGCKPLEALPAKQNNELLFLKPNGDSLCKETLALAQDDGTVAIFLRQNNRPFDDKLAVVFYDPVKNKVLASQRELDVSERVELTSHGLSFLAYDPPTDISTHSMKLRGKELTPNEHGFAYWKELKLKDGKIKTAVDRDLTWKKSDYKGFFKTQKEFEKFFQLNEKKGRYLRQWVYTTTAPDCLQASVTRDFLDEETQWKCRP